MTQAKLNNHTACEHQILFANDELFRPVVTPIVKATFDISPDGQLKFAQEQVPVNLEGEFHGDPENSSYKFEPEAAFIKTTTDVVVLGEALSRRGPVPHLLVEIQVGALHKKIGVLGNRRWLKQAVGYVISDPEPFESMPLIYENAFGGWDRRHEQEQYHGFEPRNTVGKGYYRDDVEVLDQPLWLPNLENPDALIRSIKDKPEPVGCGFTLPHWQPRAAYAGTYDQQWQENRNPLLPEDFDRKFFNAASPGFIAPQYLLGNEAVVIKNMTEEGVLQFQLPAVRPPVCEITLRHTDEIIKTQLDTVIIDVPNRQLQMIWRNYYVLPKSPHDVEAVDIRYG